MNQTFFIFAVFSTLTRPGLPGVKSPSGGVITQAGKTQASATGYKIILKNIKKTLDNQENA